MIVKKLELVNFQVIKEFNADLTVMFISLPGIMSWENQRY